ncbi:hypothetical protein [Sphingobacterium siyangense]|uniref:DUF4412 domain-containing protein n=2 Tax=Sphingobacterium TaxID=28453 RepID=A0A562MP90_9SPHI|nr:hypothetical protein [Sphingobacterium siyangense]TWI21608.1 hypothetical protein IQ31_01740 [Sphingobacterium siyangense]
MNTNRLLLFLLLLSVTLKGYAQEAFEGEIIYQNSFQSKNSSVTSEQMKILLGDKQEYFIKSGNYKSCTNGVGITMQLYIGETNRLYNKTSRSDTLYWFDADVKSDAVISYELVKNKEKILGEDCDALILKTQGGQTTYFYTSKYPVDFTKYQMHSYGNWNYYLSKAKSVPLKIVVDNEQFKMESVAQKIEARELPDDFFAISVDTPIKKTK